MAVDISKAIAALAEKGITLTEDQTKALGDALESEYRDNARKYIAKRVIASDAKAAEKAAETWTETLFNLAAEMAKNVVEEKRTVGRGEMLKRSFTELQTPNGTLKVELSRPVE